MKTKCYENFWKRHLSVHRKQLCHKPTAYLLNIAVVQRNEQRQLIVYVLKNIAILQRNGQKEHCTGPSSAPESLGNEWYFQSAKI